MVQTAFVAFLSILIPGELSLFAITSFLAIPFPYDSTPIFPPNLVVIVRYPLKDKFRSLLVIHK